MKLNCKPGDLAVIVTANKGREEFIGRLLRVIRISSLPGFWIFEASWADPEGTGLVFDGYLRPLRDNPGQDETLTWLDVPTKETA